MRFVHGKFKNFLNKFQFLLDFSPNAQKFATGFLNSFRILKFFSKPSDSLFSIKIGLFKKILSEFMKFFKRIHGFHWFFYSDFHKFASSGGSAPPNPYKCIFLNLCSNFRQKFDKIFKKFWKNREIFLKILKNCNFFHWFFYKFLEDFSGVRGLRPRNPHAVTPLTSPPLVDLASPAPEKIPAGTNVEMPRFLSCVCFPQRPILPDFSKQCRAQIARYSSACASYVKLERVPGDRLVSFVAPLYLVFRHLPLQDCHRYLLIYLTVPL